MADSFFDVYFEVEAAGMVMHNETPKHMEETITHKPPASGETYENPDVIPLFDESGNPTGVEVRAAFHTPTATPYKCYQIAGAAPPVAPVTLKTWFGVEPNVLVGPPGFLCEPAVKNGEGELTGTPYKAYQIAGSTPNKRVKLTTQFGLEPNVLVGQAKLLWEPALKNGVGDLTQTPYKCYQISDTHNPNVPVDLVTQFGLEPGVVVGLAQYLCEPALRNGFGNMMAPPYKCYGISNTVPPVVPPVDLETELSVEPDVVVGAAQLLCEPAAESVLGPAGGLAELPEVASGSGSSTGTYAALAGGLAAVLALTAGAWYARRRWAR
jgi:hypothetical protein